jgi:hypothetical protein
LKVLIPETIQLMRIERKNGITTVAYLAGNLGVPKKVRGLSSGKDLEMVIGSSNGYVSGE